MYDLIKKFEKNRHDSLGQPSTVLRCTFHTACIHKWVRANQCPLYRSTDNMTGLEVFTEVFRF